MPQQVQTIDQQHRQFFTPYQLSLFVVVVLALGLGVGLNYVDPMIVFGLVGVSLMFVLLLYSPFWGILAYLIFEYARLSAMFPALQALQFGKVIVIPTLVVWLVHYVVVKRSKIVFDRVYLLFLAWLGLALISAPMAVNQQIAFWELFDLAKWLIICVLIINLVDTLPKWQIFMWLLLLLNFKLGQFQIRSFIAGIGTAGNQSHFIHAGTGAGAGGYFSNATDFGLAMVIVVPFAFYLMKSVKSKILKLVAAGFLVTFIIAILRSGSRGAAVALFAMALVYALRSRHKLIVLVMVIVFIAGFWSFAPTAWKDRFLSARDYQQDTTASGRLELWKSGVKMVADHPFFGVGLDNFRVNYETSYRRPGVESGATVVHNIFLQAATELGIGGLMVLIAVLLLVLRRNRETRKIYRQAKLNEVWIYNFAYALDLALIGFAAGGMFLTVLYYPHLFMIIPLAVSLNQIAKKRAAAPQPTNANT